MYEELRCGAAAAGTGAVRPHFSALFAPFQIREGGSAGSDGARRETKQGEWREIWGGLEEGKGGEKAKDERGKGWEESGGKKKRREEKRPKKTEKKKAGVKGKKEQKTRKIGGKKKKKGKTGKR